MAKTEATKTTTTTMTEMPTAVARVVALEATVVEPLTPRARHWRTSPA